MTHNIYTTGYYVKYELGAQNNNYHPRWNFASDCGASGLFEIGIVIDSDPCKFTISSCGKGNSYTWVFRLTEKDKPGFPIVVTNPPKRLLQKHSVTNVKLSKDPFYIELDHSFVINGMKIEKGFVSRARRPMPDDHASVYLLDLSLDIPGVLAAPEMSWLEVSKISRSKYYRKRREQLKSAVTKDTK
jgi:hypothetical protein